MKVNYKLYFFEIAIYRTSRERFDQEYDSALRRHLEQFQELSGFACDQIPETSLHVKQHFWETYGGPWQYNQVIGWIRLYIFGSQLRGDLWKMTGKRFNRKSRNQIRYLGKAFEIYFMPDESSEQIRSKIEQELEFLQNEWFKKKRFLDLECFRNLAPCIDLRKLMDMKDKTET